MHRKSFVLCCYVFLFVPASLGSRWNFTCNDNGTIMIQYEPCLKLMTSQNIGMKRQYNLRENITENGDKAQYEYYTNFTKTDHENEDWSRYESYNTRNPEQDNRMAIEFAANSTNMKGENYSTFYSYEVESLNGKNNTECAANNNCIQLCCPLGERLIEKKCVTGEDINYTFPIIYENTNNLSQIQTETNKSLDQLFQLIVHDPCQKSDYLVLNETDDLTGNTKYKFVANGSLFQSHQKKLIKPINYCLAIVHRDEYDVIICKPKLYIPKPFPILTTIGVVLSLPFLLATFVIYSILPELHNMHGYTLRAHVISLFVAYLILAVYQQNTLTQLGYTICLILALLLTFSFAATFFWLNVMCFDIWWIFRKKTRSSQGNVKQRDKRKFILYALYGWGCAFILVFICIIIDYVLDVPENVIRPEFCIRTVWFSERIARTYYFYIPIGITIVCNVCLFISTALTITRNKKDIDQQLRNSENRRQEDNKQWLKMYLKLFILMGVIWVMEIIAVHQWAFENIPEYVFYPTDMINALQGVIIFIIFVWKKKIRLLLMKRLGCQKCLFFQRNSTTNNNSQSTTSSTTVSGTISLESLTPCDKVRTNNPARNLPTEIHI